MSFEQSGRESVESIASTRSPLHEQLMADSHGTPDIARPGSTPPTPGLGELTITGTGMASPAEAAKCALELSPKK